MELAVLWITYVNAFVDLKDDQSFRVDTLRPSNR
jgi:hypothetical protein